VGLDRSEDTFAAAVAVTPEATPGSAFPGGGPRRWRAGIPASFDVPTGIHGGMLLAVALRAAESTLAEAGDPADPSGTGDGPGDRAHQLRSVHASFLARPTDHDLVAEATVRRRGGTTAHVDVSVAAAGTDREALVARAMYGRALHDPEAWNEVPVPDLAGPDEEAGDDADELVRRQWPGPLPRLFDHFEICPALGVLPWEDGWVPGAPARYARWARWRTPATTADGALDPLALVPLADLPAPSLWVRYGPDQPLRSLLSLEMAVEVLAPAEPGWILCDFRSRHLRAGYLQVDAELFSAGRPVLAVRQTMLTRPFPVS
jgi:acyl-CoA thioesterase